MFNRSLLVKETIYIPYIYRFFIFFSLNPYFLENSELIISPVALIFNNPSTVTPSCILILSSFIFMVTSLNMSPLSRLQPDVLSTTLLSIANILLLGPNQRLLSSPYLNCSLYSDYSHILFFFLSLQFSISCNSMQGSQILHSYNSFFSCSHSLHKGLSSFLPLIPLVHTEDSWLSLSLFFLLLSLG